ncbi:hypothetical protein IWZ03DRAFT_87021 [Phyllosticta citriasiana]|uniref:Uncharacterized protein n=1 Tax=Phyllosticta citriasiana TaxID=595635 RepID=A0ABR1K967_9PEZI
MAQGDDVELGLGPTSSDGCNSNKAQNQPLPIYNSQADSKEDQSLDDSEVDKCGICGRIQDSGLEPDVRLFDFVKPCDGRNHELKTTSYRLFSDWIQDIEEPQVQDLSTSGDTPGNDIPPIVIVHGEDVLSRLEKHLRYRKELEEAIQRVRRLIGSPPKRIDTRRTGEEDLYMSWIRMSNSEEKQELKVPFTEQQLMARFLWKKEKK